MRTAQYKRLIESESLTSEDDPLSCSKGLCDQSATKWVKLLGNKHKQPVKVAHTVSRRHYYVVDDSVGSTEQTEVIIDGSYRQFLDLVPDSVAASLTDWQDRAKRKTEELKLPKVFVGTVLELRSLFLKHPDLFQWATHEAFMARHTNTPSTRARPPLKQAIDELIQYRYGIGASGERVIEN